MKIGIIGYSLSGKTTVFNTLTGQHARAESFHAAEKKANVGRIQVPDPRLDALAGIFKPQKTTPTEINFVDMAGITGSVGKGGFSAEELGWMRTVDAFTFVVRAFANEAVQHPLGRIDPALDIESLDEELALADLLVVEKRLARLEKEGKKSSPEYELLDRCRGCLENGTVLRRASLSRDEEQMLSNFQFLSLKPRLVLVNTGEENIEPDPALSGRFEGIIGFCAGLEQEIAELAPEEQAEFMEAMGIKEPGLDKFIRASYKLLSLISFFTVISDEVRAWTVEEGTEMAAAAGKIHSDMERGFIRAEVVAFEDFIAEPDMHRMKETGQLRLEGKHYKVADGDIVQVRFNV
ncbi:MAG: redox-regulated ATPase YchF [Candidatus Glassbacteria bacterium]|nr:redox-regulated ATPase YchF [Candidatus Glassbacteria bacterium]